MPNLTLAEGKEKLLDAAAYLTRARESLASIQNQLGFREGRRDMIGEFIQEQGYEIRWLTAMYNDIELDPNAKGEGRE